MPTFASPTGQSVRIEAVCGNCDGTIWTITRFTELARWRNLTGWTHVDTNHDRCGK